MYKREPLQHLCCVSVQCISAVHFSPVSHTLIITGLAFKPCFTRFFLSACPIPSIMALFVFPAIQRASEVMHTPTIISHFSSAFHSTISQHPIPESAPCSLTSIPQEARKTYLCFFSLFAALYIPHLPISNLSI